MRLVDKVKLLNQWGLVLFVLLLGVVVASSSSTQATTSGTPAAKASNGVTFSPTQKEVVVSSGLLEAVTNVTVTNNTGKSLIGTVRLVDFKTLKETGGLLFSQAGVPIDKYGLANWMALANGDAINVPDGQSRDIKVNIMNRSDLAPGGHYGAVVISLNTTIASSGQKANFKQELVSLLLVKKLGGERYGLNLESLSADSNRDIPKSVGLRFKSTGNVHVTPRGYAQVTDPRGKLVAKGIINPESTIILPETSRQFITSLSSVADSKLPGRYKITAYYRYDGQDQFSTRTVYINRFVWSPFLIVGMILTGTVVLLVMLKLLHNRRKNKHFLKLPRR